MLWRAVEKGRLRQFDSDRRLYEKSWRPSVGGRHHAGDAVADEAGLLVALDLEGEAGDDLPPAAADLVDRDDLGACRGPWSRRGPGRGSGSCCRCMNCRDRPSQPIPMRFPRCFNCLPRFSYPPLTERPPSRPRSNAPDPANALGTSPSGDRPSSRSRACAVGEWSGSGGASQADEPRLGRLLLVGAGVAPPGSCQEAAGQSNG